MMRDLQEDLRQAKLWALLALFLPGPTSPDSIKRVLRGVVSLLKTRPTLTELEEVEEEADELYSDARLAFELSEASIIRECIRFTRGPRRRDIVVNYGLN